MLARSGGESSNGGMKVSCSGIVEHHQLFFGYGPGARAQSIRRPIALKESGDQSSSVEAVVAAGTKKGSNVIGERWYLLCCCESDTNKFCEDRVGRSGPKRVPKKAAVLRMRSLNKRGQHGLEHVETRSA